MIYGNKFLPKKEESISVQEFGVESIAYNEYHNYKSLLESCTDESSKPVLEAQVQILYEVSFKDIIEKIKEAWKRFKEWVKGIFEKIFGKKKVAEEKHKKAEEATRKAEQKVKSEKNDIPKADAEVVSGGAPEEKVKKFIYKVPKSFTFVLYNPEGTEHNNPDVVEFKELENFINKMFNNRAIDLTEKKINEIDSIIRNKLIKDDNDVDYLKSWSDEFKKELNNEIGYFWVLESIEYEEKEGDASLSSMDKISASLECNDLASTLNTCAEKLVNLKKEYDKSFNKMDNTMDVIDKSITGNDEEFKNKLRDLWSSLGLIKNLIEDETKRVFQTANKILDTSSFCSDMSMKIAFSILTD